MYGIIAAMKEEMQEIKNLMTDIEIVQEYELKLYKGKINTKEILGTRSGDSCLLS